jgi:hypothetical protein
MYKEDKGLAVRPRELLRNKILGFFLGLFHFLFQSSYKVFYFLLITISNTST